MFGCGNCIYLHMLIFDFSQVSLIQKGSDPRKLYSKDKQYIIGIVAELLSQSLYLTPCLVIEDAWFRLWATHY